MSKKLLTSEIIGKFKDNLYSEEKSNVTIEKYLRDIKAFCVYLENTHANKEIVIEYKKELISRGYSVRSINSMLAAINKLFAFLGWYDCKVKPLKIQQEVFRSEEKELTRAEYMRLVNIAKKKKDEKFSLILQTICGTGIRVSELQYITVEAAQKGSVCVQCKAKTRSIFIIRELRRKLLDYAKRNGIKSGRIFITRNGKAVDRVSIWRKMKKLCQEAEVNPSKVFPHNLRHLFARAFYEIEKDVAKLADILGHSNINTTRIYIMSTGLEHCRKMEKMQLII
ncbi:MAG: tyrosine-type recombinase/integrase [Clostridia bacterium]|nr:tyrosine-type recombinase/integrase [Clostridia bacterium]